MASERAWMTAVSAWLRRQPSSHSGGRRRLGFHKHGGPERSGGAFPHDATAVKHTLATLGAKLEVLMRLLSLGHKGKQHGGEAGEGQDQRVVQRAGSHAAVRVWLRRSEGE